MAAINTEFAETKVFFAVESFPAGGVGGARLLLSLAVGRRNFSGMFPHQSEMLSHLIDVAPLGRRFVLGNTVAPFDRFRFESLWRLWRRRLWRRRRCRRHRRRCRRWAQNYNVVIRLPRRTAD